MRSSALALTLVCSACGTVAGDDDGDDHSYAETTAGQGRHGQALTAPGAWAPVDAVVAVGDEQNVDYDSAPAWDEGVNCSGAATAGARTLRDVLVAGFPQIDSVGIYSCRVIAGTNSMSIHGVGRALDIMISPIGGDADNGAGDPIAAWLMTHAQILGVQGIIFDHTIWTTSRAAGARMRAYTGSNPHIDHLHVELNEQGAFENLPWYGNPTGPGPAAVCEALPPTGGIVDAGPCQQRFGPGQFWRTEAAGVGGQLFWTNAFRSDTPGNWAKTTVKVEGGGRFDVEVHLDPAFAQFATTRYRVTGSGAEEIVVVDQGARSLERGGWALLGSFDVPAAGLTVIVEDNTTTEPPTAARRIVLDAVRVSVPAAAPDAPPPDAPPPDADAPPDAPPDAPAADTDGPVLDADDQGTLDDSGVVIVNRAASCASSSSSSSSAAAALGLTLLLSALLRRRRR